MMQGDSYGLIIEILNEDKVAVTVDDVLDVEVSIGFLQKTYSAGDVRYEEGQWIIQLSQEETFRILPYRVRIQVRVKWLDGSVEGVDLGYKHIDESISREVL